MGLCCQFISELSHLDPVTARVGKFLNINLGPTIESVNVELRAPFEEKDIRKVLNETSGVTVQDNPDTNTYPMPIYAEGKNDVFVGRIRRDYSQENTVNMWIASDNLRKGAATNAVQIGEYLVANGLV